MTLTSDMPVFNSYRDFICNRKFLTKEECEQLISVRESLTINEGTIEGGQQEEQVRKCRLTWLNRNDEFGWLYDKIQDFVENGNKRYYQFDIMGFEPLQYTVYDQVDDHYEMHIDCGVRLYNTDYHRKLSFSVQLSDPETYTGCDLEMWLANNSFLKTPREQGAITVFSSSVPHRVTQLLSGSRYVIVGWIYGPPFR